MDNLRDPIADFHRTVAAWHAEGRALVLATVVEVEGSASARPGAKAAFDAEGRNLLGWIGGGCAERFVGEQAAQALVEGRTRIVTANLDDEIFGLGVVCGGKMQVFLEPVPPAEVVVLPSLNAYVNEVRALAGFYGWRIETDSGLAPPASLEELVIMMARTVAAGRGRGARSLRLVKDLPAAFAASRVVYSRDVTILGRSRITEAIARHFTLLGFNIRSAWPVGDDFKFKEGEVVIVSSHTARDPEFVGQALAAGCGYVGMVGSRLRALEVINYLNLSGLTVTAPLFVPTGLDIDARNPEEIALAIVAEVLEQGR